MSVNVYVPVYMFVCCASVCVSNWENRNEFSVTSTSVVQTIEAANKTKNRHPDKDGWGREGVNGCRGSGADGGLCGIMLFTCLARFILYCRSALVQGFCQIKANKGRAFCFQLFATGNWQLPTLSMMPQV